MRRAARALGAAFVLAGAIACAHRYPTAPAPSPPTPASAAPAPTPAPSGLPSGRRGTFATLAEAEPALVSAEDRRAYDAPILDAASASPEPSVRARAALALGRIGDERAVAPLRTLLSDASPAVREQAAFAAGILGDPSLSAALAARLADGDERVVARAAWAIGMLGQKEGAESLASALRAAATPARRVACLRGIWRFSEEAAAAAAPFAADADPSVRTAVLYALARRPQASSLALLTAGLSDPDPQTAASCARALGLVGTAGSLGPLARLLGTGPTPARINALLALATLLERIPGAAPDPEWRERIAALSSDVNPNLAVPAVALLRWYAEDRDAFRRLWTLATAGTERRQQVALQALMAGLGARSMDLVDRALSSPDPFLRASAAEGLSFLPEADSAPRRARLAEDPAVVVRLKLLEGLRTPAAVSQNRELVDRLRGDTDAGVRAAAIDALSLSGGAGALVVFREMVVQSYGERAPDVPIAAIGAAEKTPGTPEARAVVEAAYRHPSTLVSRLARRSLVKIFGADPAAFPWRTYDTGKTVADYAVLIAEARRPWRLRVETARGTFTVRLDGKTAPLTVMNCLSLAGKEFFDGAPIHRVVPNFVVQDGDPTGTGNGGPGYEIRDELSDLAYQTGTTGMALAGPDTGGSQWFVTQAPEPHLDGGYTVFGSVASGLDVVLRIEQGDRILRLGAFVENPSGGAR
jgi:cyclophilin family peptidyl-prolyl cis-trans isomerase/HEAT repeat protein